MNRKKVKKIVVIKSCENCRNNPCDGIPIPSNVCQTALGIDDPRYQSRWKPKKE
jgi:hypothetical protein